jgi:N-methylhydantoinase B/oxoprolinase/acetone carboxylase alpha subunit
MPAEARQSSAAAQSIAPAPVTTAAMTPPPVAVASGANCSAATIEAATAACCCFASSTASAIVRSSSIEAPMPPTETTVALVTSFMVATWRRMLSMGLAVVSARCLTSAACVRFEHGGRIRFRTAGGGSGDPARRGPGLIAEDVAESHLSPEAAGETCGRRPA